MLIKNRWVSYHGLILDWAQSFVVPDHIRCWKTRPSSFLAAIKNISVIKYGIIFICNGGRVAVYCLLLFFTLPVPCMLTCSVLLYTFILRESETTSSLASCDQYYFPVNPILTFISRFLPPADSSPTLSEWPCWRRYTVSDFTSGGCTYLASGCGSFSSPWISPPVAKFFFFLEETPWQCLNLSHSSLWSDQPVVILLGYTLLIRKSSNGGTPDTSWLYVLAGFVMWKRRHSYFLAENMKLGFIPSPLRHSCSLPWWCLSPSERNLIFFEGLCVTEPSS